MKKVLLVAAVIAICGLAGCKKEKTCVCTTTFNSEFAKGTAEIEVQTKEKKCSSLDESLADSVVTCKEK